jgi:hypothetical protein
VKAFIAGDLHHYRRFEKDGVQKITAGGGGAFLHPTHDFDFRKAKKQADQSASFKGFSLVGEYPDYKTSKKMGWRDLGFLFHNWSFGIMTGAIYFVLGTSRPRADGGQHLKWTDDGFWLKAIKITVNRNDRRTSCDTRGRTTFARPYILHRFREQAVQKDRRSHSRRSTFDRRLHVGWLAYLLSLWISANWNVPEISTRYNLIWFFTVLVVSGVGGYVVGSVIMGIYLYVSLHVSGDTRTRHSRR